MNFFTDLLFTQYYELKSKERPTTSAKNTGILLISTLVIMALVAIFLVLNASGVIAAVAAPIQGRLLGRLVGAILLAAAFGVVYLIFGKQEKYDGIIREYERKPAAEQLQIFKSGMKKFFLVFVILLVAIIVAAIL
jgi:Ca2+/Na+ antiporter